MKDKYLPPDQIEERLPSLRKGKTLVTLNGSFDLLHAGHLYQIREAKKQGDILLVALNSDDSIRQYKGKDRPIIPLKERMEMMMALEEVDYVTFFEETDPIALLEKIKPDVHANGAEYGENCIEAAAIKRQGGRLHLVDRIDGLSTSQIIERIKTTCAL
jgi:rfaE bifunctional protein nucleotidyltransferase chain/domain